MMSNPCRVARSTDKGKVERLVRVARKLFRMLKELHPSAILAALEKLGLSIDGTQNGRARHGQVPFGWDIHDCRPVRNGLKQQVIRLMRQLAGGDESLHGIARELNRRLVPTKNAGLWQANTVRLVLHRATARAAS